MKIDPKKDGAIQRIVNPVAATKRQVDVIVPKLSKAARAGRRLAGREEVGAGAMGQPLTRPYRPPEGVLSRRPKAPKPPPGLAAGDPILRQWRRWGWHGLADDYERMRGEMGER